MATRFYLTTASAPYTPATIRGAWDDTAGAVTKALALYKGDGGNITTVARAETDASATYDVLLYRGVSYPLKGLIFNGTVDVVLGILESDAVADMYWHVHIYITTGDSDTVRFTLVNNYVENTTNEFGVTALTCGLALQSAQAYNTSPTPSAEGDRIVVEIGYISREASATSRTGTLYYGTKNATTGDTSSDLAVAGDPTLSAGWIEFSSNILEVTDTNEIRETQALGKVLSANTPAIRETQVLGKALSANTPAIRETQVLGKALSANTPAIRETQVLGKVLYQTVYPVPSKFYLANTAAPYTPATIRGSWDNSASVVTKKLTPYREDGGTITTVSVAETSVSPTNDTLLYRGVSYPLASQTLAGTLDVTIGIIETDVAADLYWHIYSYITTGDSDTVRTVIVNDYVENTTNEFSVSGVISGLKLSTPPTVSASVAQGDRLVVEIGYIARNSVATSYSSTLYYGTKNVSTLGVLDDLAVSGDGTNSAGFITFSNGLLEDTSAIAVRDTQVLTKVLTANTPYVRDTQVLTKVLTANTPYIRDTQTLTKVLTANTPYIRNTQTMIKVLRSTAMVTFNPSWARNSNVVIKQESVR